MDEDRGEHEQPEPPPSVVPPISVPEQPDHGIQHNGAESEQQGAANDGRWVGFNSFLKGSDTPNWVMAFLTIVITAGTIGQCVLMTETNDITRESNRITRESNELTRQAMIGAQRPWVIVEHIEEMPLPAALAPVTINLDLRNTGNSPALNTLFWGYVALNPEEMTDFSAPPSKLISSAGVVTPGKTWEVFLHAPLFSEEVLVEVRAGRLLWQVWGRITYQDVFGKKRRTNFSAVYDVEDGSWNVPRYGNWAE